jgi:toxin-antitoxin system PIN domain toxin
MRVLVPDVNILIYAHRPESARHSEYRDWLTARLTGDEPFGVSELVLSGFLRITTNARAYVEPTPPDVAMLFCDSVRDSPAAVPVRPGKRHWSIFAELYRAAGARANLVPDAFQAALAIELGATWVTTDRGFARWPELRWEPALSST